MEFPHPARRPRLKAIEVPGFPTAIEVPEGGLVLGRAEDCGVRLSGDEWPSVSSHHARVVPEGEALVLEDLGSRNGTLVNGEAVERRALKGGDVLQLGALGPRFFVVGASNLQETVFVDKQALGLGDSGEAVEASVRGVERRARRRSLLVLAVVLLVLTGAVEFARRQLQGDRRVRDEREAALVDELSRQLQSLKDLERREQASEQRITSLTEERDLARRELGELREGRTRLQERIDLLEQRDDAGDELDDLRAELADTNARVDEAARDLERLDPVNLEQARLDEVRRVRGAVVLIESRVTLVDREDGSVLHVLDPESGAGANFDGLGEPFVLESSGTGFCVSPEGWVLTNRHVVSLPDDPGLRQALRSLPIEAHLELFAVFSGQEVRHPLTVVRALDPGGPDLALAHLEPYPGMPYLDDFDPGQPLPPEGTDVFVLGFPFGTFALQEGDRVIASTFRGILSRAVDGNLQVDAGVHPGNSGGPIVDSRGRVVGVVFSVQSGPDRTAVFTIGYGIPVGETGVLWPPSDADRARLGADGAGAGSGADGDEGTAPEDGDGTSPTGTAPGPDGGPDGGPEGGPGDGSEGADGGDGGR